MASNDEKVAVSETLLQVRPTVFVALGGTGMEILLRLRRRILQADWNGGRLNAIDEFPAAAFLYFDTDTVGARESGRAAQTDPLAAKVAFTESEALQKAINLARYQAERKRYPHIDEWLPGHDLSRIDASKGAGQIRCISRLLFFDEYKTFMDRMSLKANAVLSNMSNEARLKAVGLNTNTDLRVVVIGSVAGGTGSGTIIDVGYAVRSMETPKQPKAVELFLVLPSGYVGANKERVFANGFAALSELEYTMRGNPNPPYVTRWTDVERPSALIDRPYTDLYLFDTHNLADQKTNNVTDLYDMMADVLFEDFGNSEFAGRKRSIGVNQTQHKMRKWAPPTSAEVGVGAVTYSQNYSALGQAIIATRGSLEFEAAATQASLDMVEAFFGIARGGPRKVPAVEERNRFLEEKLGLGFASFDIFPKVLHPRPDAIHEFELVGRLLQRADNSSIEQSVTHEIEEKFSDIKVTGSDITGWSAAVRLVAEKLREDILGRTGHGTAYGPRGGEVAENRVRLEGELFSQEGERSLRDSLYRLLDDQERGGLDYAVALMEQVKQALEDEGGAIARLRQVADAYADISDRMLSRHFQDSLARLEQVKPGLLFKRRADGERYLDQVREDLRDFAVLRLRAIAAREAITLLQHVSARLGSRTGVDEGTGRGRHDGLRGEFEQGRADVDRLVGELRLDLDQINSAIGRASGGTFLVLQSGSLQPIPRNQGERLGWAREAFKGYGGSRSIFRLLREEKTRSQLLNAIRDMSKRQLGGYQSRIPAAFAALRELAPGQQRQMLEKMILRSLPWIFANFDAFKPTPDQYKMIIAVEGAHEFEAEFGPMIRAALPAQHGGSQISYFESGARGRIVCYCELSGIPLDVLASLRRDWRASYEQELNRSDAIPLHNHRDYLRFPDPVVPSLSEVEALRDALSLFIRGFCLGAFRRDPESGRYQFEFENGDWRSIGSERTLRRKQFDPAQRYAVEARILRQEANLSPIQVLAAATLFEWTAKRAYAPRREQINFDAEQRVGGMAHHAALALARQWRRNALAMPGLALSVPPDAAYQRLAETVEQWTVAIPDSLADVETAEANRSMDDQVHLRAVDKRTVDPARFTTSGLQQFLEPAAPAAPAAPAFATSPPPATTFYVYLNGEVAGPYTVTDLTGMVRSGAVSAATKVHPEGGAWMEAGAHPVLMPLFRAAPPPPPPPPNRPGPPPA